MKDIECPYCGEEQDVNHDDGYGWEEDFRYEQECSNCGKFFVYTTYISYSYTAHKSDCLNGGEHKYRLSHTWPKEFSVMVCKDCGAERPLTDAEIIEYKIPQFEKMPKGR